MAIPEEVVPCTKAAQKIRQPGSPESLGFKYPGDEQNQFVTSKAQGMNRNACVAGEHSLVAGKGPLFLLIHHQKANENRRDHCDGVAIESLAPIAFNQ
ncbi:hypothetical protein Slin15195_G088550 [Septoria linicola]|uniref:Uncharacterized protein n=1 Tax=Septoria linicola TaxID=215465 RepID=A0A9Q9B1G9_9PEZI|nr:hypothetical protein Slin15195_G088550 [Septoria linicola]